MFINYKADVATLIKFAFFDKVCILRDIKQKTNLGDIYKHAK